MNVDLNTAMTIANKMVKPWQYTTMILSAVIAGLLYHIVTATTVINSDVTAEDVTATKLESTLDAKVN